MRDGNDRKKRSDPIVLEEALFGVVVILLLRPRRCSFEGVLQRNTS
jgi:hypothetical protein